MSDKVDIKHDKLFVAAIDFGTTYSGYAVCTRDEYTKNTNNPKMKVREWNEGSYITDKAPTCVLFNPDKELDSFGYDAMTKFRTNPNSMDFRKWYYFEHFKMMLFKEKDMLTKETMLEESLEVKNPEMKKKMKAVDVFAAVIKYFKKDLVQSKNQQGTVFTDADIQWVITVPAIWDLKAKQFMRDAAEQAGILRDNLTLALEPEAASLYCRKVPVSIKEEDDGGKVIAAMDVGSKYVVLDQGGGTTDIAVHEVTGRNTLKEIHQACGGHWGGITVNGEFYNFLIRLLGGDVINEVKNNNPSDYYQLLYNFEHTKTSFTDEHSKHPNDKQTLRVPYSWLQHFKIITDCELEETVKQSTYKGKITISRDKLRIKNELFRTFFDYSLQHIVEKMEELLKKKQLEGVETILIVGGHSNSTVLTNAIYKNFGNKYGIVIPKNPDIAVMKGAVLFGFNPEMITSRVSQYTYGIAMQRPFTPGVDPESKKKYLINGLVDNVFDKHVEVGQVVNIGEFLPEHDYVPAGREYKGVHFEFYATQKKNPKYVTDDGCSCIGVLYFELTDISKRKDMTLKLNVSGTEIVAIITEKSTGKQSNGYFSLLD
ncbi:heat shock 70 kDa protein 12A-like isoform X1 [Mytilus californianus]|uniref:heat shock 70 kDa protein 12A-like isoform X1 n=1 Tax=Mytilus californianus TaxID=6549 RepID=UPI0022453C7A|nr:heat shock 70 kDa protein 12A-like isoform X1 [Mytilus californianus]XP_052089535.1 heat shock 70 kDa protein 12A-like isoform X1 [Mytilus californianus]